MASKVYALVDCNSFFCSCERLFRPDLRHRPVGVLSNNDGCFVSRTPELKKLGVAMGEPYFKVKDLCRKNNVAVFSSNFSLYTNISDRVMLTLAHFTPELEVYSVDEAFLNLSGFQNLGEYARIIKTTVEQHTGIPVSIGVAPTKTLAKVANHMAKKNPQSQGVVVLMEPSQQTQALKNLPVEEVWGIGRASSYKLRSLGVRTALEFRDYKNDRLIQKLFTKVGLQRKQELQGSPRFELELFPSKKQEIMVSRSFGQGVTDLEGLRQSVATHVSRASEKLRRQNSLSLCVQVYIRTSPFKNVPQRAVSMAHTMESPTADTVKIIRYAFQALDQLYRQGYEYKKAGVRLSEIVDHDQAQLSLFQMPDSDKSERLMACMDQINRKEGTDTVFVAACGTKDKKWTMNRQFHSPRYVTGWSELPKVR
jgi:DNA polymerase V